MSDHRLDIDDADRHTVNAEACDIRTLIDGFMARSCGDLYPSAEQAEAIERLRDLIA